MLRETNRRTWLILLALVAGVLTVGAAYKYYAPGGVVVANQQKGRIQISPANWDFGEISPDAKVSHSFNVANVGPGPLKIKRVSTSCGCTTAEVGESNLAPGEETSLTVTFDPQVHNGALGRFLRQVDVASDDPNVPRAIVDLHVTVAENPS